MKEIFENRAVSKSMCLITRIFNLFKLVNCSFVRVLIAVIISRCYRYQHRPFKRQELEMSEAMAGTSILFKKGTLFARGKLLPMPTSSLVSDNDIHAV